MVRIGYGEGGLTDLNAWNGWGWRSTGKEATFESKLAFQVRPGEKSCFYEFCDSAASDSWRSRLCPLLRFRRAKGKVITKAMMIKDRREADKHGDAPDFDSDPFIGGQDWEIGAVDIVVNDTAPDKASATASFRNFDMPTKVVFDLIKLKTGWRIADIDWGEDGTLRDLYVKK